MGRATAGYSNKLVNKYVKYIETQKKYIRKNFEDMDFENADARDDFEAVVEKMERDCDTLISEISGYSFE